MSERFLEVDRVLETSFFKAVTLLNAENMTGVLYEEGSNTIPRVVFGMELHSNDNPSTFWQLMLDPKERTFKLNELGPWETTDNFGRRRKALPRIDYNLFVDLTILTDENSVIFRGEDWSFKITRYSSGELEFSLPLIPLISLLPPKADFSN